MTDSKETELDEYDEETSESPDFMTEPFNPVDINIVVEPKSLDTLIKRIQHNEIDMNADFQRNADLWGSKQMSRLIESILIRFPLPAFYFDASEDENWLIVDGLQRLSAIRKFVVDNKLRRLTDRLIPDGFVFLFLFKAWKPRIARLCTDFHNAEEGQKDPLRWYKAIWKSP